MPIFSLAMKSILNRRFTALITVAAIAISLMLLPGVERVRVDARTGFANTISGTDLVVGLEGAHATGRSGVPSAAGSIARWPSGRVSLQPSPGALSGTLVVMPGDLNLTFGGFVQMTFNEFMQDHPTQGEYEIPRARLDVRGAAAEGFSYRIFWDLDRSGARLEDA